MQEIRKKRKVKVINILILILGIILVLVVVAGLFYYLMIAPPSKPRVEVKNPVQDLSFEEAVLQFNEEYIDYLVFAIGGWKLHNPPLSSETPKIEVIVDDEVFISEIINGEIKTEKKQIEEEDIIIRTTKQEIVNSILSGDMKSYIKESVSEGKTTLELKASKTTLFVKGYLRLYKDITGESFTGSVIKIFEKEQ